MKLEELQSLFAEVGVVLPMSRMVLLVDDEQLDVIEQLLEGHCDIITATSGPIALDIVESQKIDVVVADQRMPTMTGLELLEIVKERHPLIVRIILTAYSDTDVIIQSINRGEVYRFLLKPWRPEELYHTINSAIEYKYIREGLLKLVAELRQKNSSLASLLADLRASQDKLLHSDRLATLGKFAASMSHDLRNELFVLKGTVSLMKEMKVNQQVLEMLEMESSAIENLQHLIEGIYDYSRMERSPLVAGAENINRIIDEVIMFLRWRSDFKNVRWITHFEPLPSCRVDRRKMKQLVTNLLVNSAEALAGKTGTVEVFTRRSGDDTIQIEIRDSGKGIADDIAAEIWKPFFSTKNGTGLGLGLDICRQIAKLHGGKIYFTSEPGKGTSFYVEIPEKEILAKEEKDGSKHQNER